MGLSAVTVATRLADRVTMRRASMSSGDRNFAVGECQQLAGVVHIAGMVAETLDAPRKFAPSRIEGRQPQRRSALALAIAFVERRRDVAL